MMTLPHSLEAERAVLAGLLLTGEQALSRLAPLLTAEDFYFERHREIWQSAGRLAGNGGIDERTLQGDLEQRGKLELVGGVAYLVGLDVDLPDLERLEAYAQIVRERSLRRRLIALSSELCRNCLDGGLAGEEALTTAELALRELAQRAIPSQSVSIGEAVTTVLEEIEERDGPGAPGHPTGFDDVDRIIYGLRPGNFLVLGGRPGTGKTTWTLNLLANLAIRRGLPVGIFSIEMTHDELALRLLCAEACVSHERLMLGYLSQRQWSDLIQTARRVSPAPLHIDDDGALDLPRLAARARRWRAELGIECIAVDHLSLMTAGGNRRWSNRTEEVAAITRGLKQLAKELDIPVIALSQLSRQSERRTDHRPQLADLRESGSSEQDADVVLFTYRDELYSPDDPSKRGLAEIIVAKNRHGRTGTADLAFIGEECRFANLAPAWREANAPPARAAAAPAQPSIPVAAQDDPF
jgi:replicative DNA helicase